MGIRPVADCRDFWFKRQMSYGGDLDRGPFLNVINWVLIAIALGTYFCPLSLHEVPAADNAQ